MSETTTLEKKEEKKYTTKNLIDPIVLSEAAHNCHIGEGFKLPIMFLGSSEKYLRLLFVREVEVEAATQKGIGEEIETEKKKKKCKKERFC